MDLLVMYKSLETIDRRRSFRLASEELVVDQSTLNKRIKRLEAHYNTELVIRNGKKINMTIAAKSILFKYREIQEILNKVESEIMKLEDYQIATTSDVLLNTPLSEHINDNLHICDDYQELIDGFNNGKYREILVEKRFEDLINYEHKEQYAIIEAGVIGSLDIPNELLIDELIEDCNLIGNRYDPFARIASFYLKEHKNFDFEEKATLFDCQQDVINEIIHTEKSYCIVPTVLVLTERISSKVKSVKLKDCNLTRTIYRYKR